eukprot:scaffold29752_cov112-Isochrysis_galbana.AAC.1
MQPSFSGLLVTCLGGQQAWGEQKRASQPDIRPGKTPLLNQKTTREEPQSSGRVPAFAPHLGRAKLAPPQP